MKTTTPKLLLALACLLLSLQAKASIIVSLEPTPQTISVGDPVSMDLVVSGLGDHASPSLGGFLFDLTYDPTVLAAVSVSFGNQLDLGILGSTRFSDLTTLGTVHLDELSFESISDLVGNQPSGFTLATLAFKGIAPGISPITFLSGGSLSDETGQVSLDFTTANGQVEVTGAVVPEASTFLAGLLMLLPFGLQGIRLLRKS